MKIMKKIKIINFQTLKVENCYDYREVYIFLDRWLDTPISEQEDFINMYKRMIYAVDKKPLCIKLYSDAAFYQEEILELFSRFIPITLTTESTDKGYLACPPYLVGHIQSTINAAKNLGNFKNKFPGLNIGLFDEDGNEIDWLII